MWMLMQIVSDPIPVKQTIDEIWITRVAEGDMNAFRQLYDALSDSIYAFSYSLLHNKTDAEDVLQETFLRIHTHAKTYHPQGKPLAWIFTIARHLAQDKFRQQDHVQLLNENCSAQIDVSDIENTEHRILLHALLNNLSEEDRQIVVLHTAVGMKYREIAVVMGMPINTVLSRHHRALKRLKTIAKEEHLYD